MEGVRAKNLEAIQLYVDFSKVIDSIHRKNKEQILLVYDLPKETTTTMIVLYWKTKVKVRSPDGDTDFFDFIAGFLQGDTLGVYLFIICLDYILRTSIDIIKENGFTLKKRQEADDILQKLRRNAESLIVSAESQMISSSSCHAASMDVPDILSPPVSIIHHSR